MHHHIHNGGEQRENRQELTEAQFKCFERHEWTRDQIASVHDAEDRFADDDGAVTEFEFNGGKDAETDEQDDEHHEVELHREYRDARVTPEIFEQESTEARHQDADERLCSYAFCTL